MYPRKIKNFNAMLDGMTFAGKVVSAQLPELATKNSTYRAGGMEGEIDVAMGLEKMGCKIVLAEWNPVVWSGFAQRKLITLRAADQGEVDFNAVGHVFSIGGRWNKISGDEFKSGEDVNLALELTSVEYFKVEVEGRALVEIDIENGIRMIDGVDQMASMRQALAI